MKRICCLWLCFHLPIEAACWYSEASEQLPQEWDFFYQICTVGAPDDLYASHRSFPKTCPLWTETQCELWRWLYRSQDSLANSVLYHSVKHVSLDFEQHRRDAPLGSSSYISTSAFGAGKLRLRRIPYIASSPSRKGKCCHLHTLCIWIFVFGTGKLRLHRSLWSTTSPSRVGKCCHLHTLYIGIFVFGAGKLRLRRSLCTLTSAFGAGTWLFPSTLCRSCLQFFCWR